MHLQKINLLTYLNSTMIKNLKFALLAVALLAATTASAQFTFGVQGGVNRSIFHESTTLCPGDDDEPGTGMCMLRPKFGFNIGVVTDLALTWNTSIRSGLSFTTKGTAEGVNDDRTVISLMYLQVPVHFAYLLFITRDIRVVLQGGPYMAFGVGGSVSTNVEGAFEGNSFGRDEYQFSPFDLGMGVGISFEFGRMFAGINWDAGVLNISNHEGEDAVRRRTRNTSFLTLGYWF